MAKSGSEQRKFKRYEVDSVHGKMLYSSDINILNISMDGAAVATTQRLVIDREYSLKLKFEGTVLNLRGKVVWSVLSHSRMMKNGEVAPVYRAGIRFTNVLTDAASNLISYIERNRSNPLEQRILGVRFRINSAEGAKIDLSCEYSIKKISLSGMLIETEAPLEIDTRHLMEIMLDGTKLMVTGRIANQTEVQGRETGAYNVGIEFLEIPDADKQVLKSYLDAIELGN